MLIDTLVHEKLLDLFYLYLIIGGIPAVVEAYLKTKNLHEVFQIQEGIIKLYKKDIAQYDPKNKLYLEEIFQLIPSELNCKNKRFIWLKEAGVALPVYCASEPTLPLILSRSTNLFKLFMSDVGLLSSMYADGIQVKLLKKETNINYGSVYENAAAQELWAHGFDLYYFNSKKQGEIDFLIEQNGEVLPIEIKSGKGYTKHSALDNLLNSEHYHIEKAFVFCNENVKQEGKIIYYPIYMCGFLQKQKVDRQMIYDMDLSVLQS